MVRLNCVNCPSCFSHISDRPQRRCWSALYIVKVYSRRGRHFNNEYYYIMPRDQSVDPCGHLSYRSLNCCCTCTRSLAQIYLTNSSIIECNIVFTHFFATRHKPAIELLPATNNVGLELNDRVAHRCCCCCCHCCLLIVVVLLLRYQFYLLYIP